MSMEDQNSDEIEIEAEEEYVLPVEDETDKLTVQAAFGDAIRLSASSPAVELVLAKAQASYLEAVKEFVTLNLTAPDGLYQAMRCQNDMNRFTDMVEWLAIAVKGGKRAEAELKRRHKELMKNRGMEAYYGTEKRS